jgi:uncharacterized protein involved in exopolysaccharide biosynthesis
LENSNNYIEEDRVSLGLLIKRLIDWIRFLISKWLIIGFGAFFILLLMVSYNYLKKPTYFAKTSFVLENEGSSGLSKLSPIASIVGVSVGDMAESSPLFQLDNIQSLYSSRIMLEKTLLSDATFGDKQEKVIKRLAVAQKLAKQWAKAGIDLDAFDLPRTQYSRAQDSVILEVIEIIQENHLHVDKLSRKTTILEVGFRHKDELLAKIFNELHVRHVNKFYQETKTKKTYSNLQVLQSQADSVKKILDASIQQLAELGESTPNPNPMYKTTRVPYQKALIQVQANSAIYQEIIKQLEMAKVAHRNTLPLIQIIDSPMLPLEDNRWRLLKTIVIGAFIGAMTMVFFLTLKQVILQSMEELDQ